MNEVQITLPAELLEAVGVRPADASRELAGLLALVRSEHRISLRRAAELCGMPPEAFMVFAGKRGTPMHYSLSDLETKIA